jgi:DNA-binding transcriptional MerR regulator
MLRYYEQQGLITPARADNGYRTYTVADIDRVITIRGLIRSGLPTRLVAVILDMNDASKPPWTRDCTRQFATMLAEEMRVLDDRIACLTRSRDTVRRFLADTEHADLVPG